MAVRPRQNWSSADNLLHQVHFLQEVSSAKMPIILTKAGVKLQCVGACEKAFGTHKDTCNEIMSWAKMAWHARLATVWP